MIDAGWIKLHRKTLDNDIFKFDYTAWHVFEVLLLHANRRTGEWKGGGFVLAQMCEQKRPTMYKALKRLEKAKMVTLSSNNRYTVVCICNYFTYQNPGNKSGNTSGNNTVTTGEQLGNTNNNIGKQELRIKNKEERESAHTPANPLRILYDQTAVTDALADFEAQFPDYDVAYEWQKCQDHFAATGKVTKNWPARFRNWLRSDIPKKAKGDPDDIVILPILA